MPRLTFSSLTRLKNELTTNPLSRAAYSSTAQAKADDLNTKYRPLDGAIEALRTYCFNNSNNPTNRNATSIWILSEDVVAGVHIAAVSASNGQIDAARALLQLINMEADATFDFTEANLAILLGRLATAEVMTTAQSTDIQNLSANKITRAAELGLPKLSAQDITDAEALP